MSWPAPKGLGISPPDDSGLVIYNHPFDPERLILDFLDEVPDVLSYWHDRADRGSDWAEALRLPGGQP